MTEDKRTLMKKAEARAKEINRMALQVKEAKDALIGEVLAARKEGDITQREWEEISGIRQPMIARIEGNLTNPRLDTLLKLLVPLGLTLKVVPLEKER